METIDTSRMTAAQLANIAYLGGNIYVMWDGGALHLREVAGGPEEIEGPGDWVTLRPDMIQALMLFCEARRIP